MSAMVVSEYKKNICERYPVGMMRFHAFDQCHMRVRPCTKDRPFSINSLRDELHDWLYCVYDMWLFRICQIAIWGASGSVIVVADR